MIKALLLFLLMFGATCTIYGQEEAEYFVDTEQEEEGVNFSGVYVGLESLRLMESVIYTVYADDNLVYKQLYALEAISYYQGKGIWRPTIRLGYIWLEDRQDVNSSKRNHKVIMSRGGYVKLGADILTSQKENENHALGIHGVLSYGNEYYNFRVGNDFFGYKDSFYSQSTWAQAVELRYTYSQMLAKKFNYQLGAYVTVFDWSSKELLAYRNLPGMNYSLGVFLHILYKVDE